MSPRLGFGRRWRRAALLGIGVLAVTVAAPSGATPGTRALPEAGSVPANTTSTSMTWPPPGRTDLGPGGGFPDAPPGTVSGQVAASSQGLIDRRAQQYVTTTAGSPIFFVVYVGEGNTPLSDPTSFQLAAVPDPFYQPACALAASDPHAKLDSTYGRNLLYAAWPPTGGAVAGAFPPIQVKTVAFGAIPVTARLRLTQHRVDGILQPLLDQYWDPTGSPPPSCDPTYQGKPSFLVTGQVDIALTGLTVDGEPVDVGSSCRTVSPVQVALWGTKDYGGLGQGGTLGQYDGLHPGSLGKLDSPYYRAQDGTTIPASTGLDIPAFTGCRGKTGDDISRLVTAMASGPDNPVSADQAPATSPNQTLDLNNLTKCFSDNTGRHCPIPAHDPPPMPPH